MPSAEATLSLSVIYRSLGDGNSKSWLRRQSMQTISVPGANSETLKMHEPGVNGYTKNVTSADMTASGWIVERVAHIRRMYPQLAPYH